MLTDEHSLIPMLIDTSASTSVYPHSCISTGNLSASKHHLVRAGGAPIDCYGSRMIPLQFQRRRFTWDFEIVEIKKPFLGADLLIAHGLVVDLKRGCVTSNEDQHLVLPCSLHVLSTSGDFSINRIHRLLKLADAKAAFAKLEAAGIIRHSNSPWSSPLHMVRKKTGGDPAAIIVG